MLLCIHFSSHWPTFHAAGELALGHSGDGMEQATAQGAAKALAAAVATFAMLGIGTARATDQGITGKRFLLKSGKFVLLPNDPPGGRTA